MQREASPEATWMCGSRRRTASFPRRCSELVTMKLHYGIPSDFQNHRRRATREKRDPGRPTKNVQFRIRGISHGASFPAFGKNASRRDSSASLTLKYYDITWRSPFLRRGDINSPLSEEKERSLKGLSPPPRVR